MHNYEHKIEKNNRLDEEQSGQLSEPNLDSVPEKDLAVELEIYRHQAQAMIDGHKRFFMTFASDSSLSFKLSNAFQIDLETGQVHLDISWFKERNYTQEQILWAVMHELAHFRDLAEDPEGMMANFSDMTEQARDTGAFMMAKWEAKYGESNPEAIERLKKTKPIGRQKPPQTLNNVEMAAYRIHHTFYNIFDDIYVNNLVNRRAPRFAEGTGVQAVSDLYQEKLFKQTDYSSLPRHLQFLYKLIREEMVIGEKVATTPEVQEVLEQKIMFQGQEYTAREIVDNFLKPKKYRDTKASSRYVVLQNTLEPLFLELLKKDLEDWDPELPPQPEQSDQSGESSESGQSTDPFGADYDDFEKNNPDQLDQNEIDNWLDKQEEKQAEAEAEKSAQTAIDQQSPEEKSAQAQESMDKAWCQKQGIDFATLQKFRQIEASVEPYLQALSQLWQRIIFGSSKDIERSLEGYFKTGSELDIQEAINQWPQISKGNIEEARVMKRDMSNETLVRQPELIRVRLVGDMSGSMDQAKKQVLQQCFVLILRSLQEFQTMLNISRVKNKSRLQVDSEAWIFGTGAEKIKSLRGQNNPSDEQADIIKIFEKLQKTIGSTRDNRPLENISQSLTPQDLEKIDQKKIMEIVLEITDGGSDDPNATRQAVDNLLSQNVIARSFQIGEVDESDKLKFQQVWNKNREQILGEVVGTEIKNLLPAISKVLAEYLAKVRL